MTRALAVVLTLAACGAAARRSAIEVPARAATAGDRILGFAPAGADAVLEVDLARLRRNPALGPVIRALSAGGETVPGFDLFGQADLVVMCSYGLGRAEPERLTFLTGPHVADLAGALPLGDGVVVIGPAPLVGRARTASTGASAALTADRELLRLRALAMPASATGAALRLTARLTFDARLALARQLDVDAVPVSLSAWGDVADDLAIVALLSGGKPADGDALANALAHVAEQARRGGLGQLGLGPVLARTRIERHGSAVRAVLVVGPARLGRVVGRIMATLGATPPP